MQKLSLVLIFLFIAGIQLRAQEVSGKLQFEPGKTMTINMEIKNNIAQQAGAQAINFTINGSATHHYKVIKLEAGRIFLDYDLSHLEFEFVGMGQRKSFDSDNKNDREGPYGKQLEGILSKKYSIIIDSMGRILATSPETIPGPGNADLLIITTMLKELTSVAYSTKTGMPGFFHVLPDHGAFRGESWVDGKKSPTAFTVSVITDSTIVVDYKTIASSVIRSEMTGSEAKTSMTDITTGKIILDRKTGIIREKTSVTESNGTTEAMGGIVPLTGKTITSISVKQDE